MSTHTDREPKARHRGRLLPLLLVACVPIACEGFMSAPVADKDKDNEPDRFDCAPDDPLMADDCDQDGVSIKDGDCNDHDARVGGKMAVPCPVAAGSGPCTEGVWVCGGADGTDVVCKPNTPMPETCNGRDDDCNGIVDDGVPGVNVVCDTGALGACKPGLTACLDGHITCKPVHDPSVELCDSLPGGDEDCDGATNENCGCSQGQTMACYDGPIGTEQHLPCHAGLKTCTIDGIWGPCIGQVFPPLGMGTVDLCDQAMVDEDCDGQPNQNCICNDGDQAPCYSGPPGTDGVGICKKGIKKCTIMGDWGPCEKEQIPLQEVCDGPPFEDEDCDGVSNPPNLCTCNIGELGTCYTGPVGTKNVGICHGGTFVCAAPGVPGPCIGEQTPQAEVCDGNQVDEDCDGLADTADCKCINGTTAPCLTALPGECKQGTKVCAGGNWQPCVSNVSPQPSETQCDGKDEDCNGIIDDIDPGVAVSQGYFSKSCGGGSFKSTLTHPFPACKIFAIPYITSYPPTNGDISYEVSVVTGSPSTTDYELNVSCSGASNSDKLEGYVTVIAVPSDPFEFADSSEPFGLTASTQCYTLSLGYLPPPPFYTTRLDVSTIWSLSAGANADTQWSAAWDTTSAFVWIDGSIGTALGGRITRLGFKPAAKYFTNCSKGCLAPGNSIVTLNRPPGLTVKPIFGVDYFGEGGSCPSPSDPAPCSGNGSTGHGYYVDTTYPTPSTVQFSVQHISPNPSSRLGYTACIVGHQ